MNMNSFESVTNNTNIAGPHEEMEVNAPSLAGLQQEIESLQKKLDFLQTQEGHEDAIKKIKEELFNLTEQAISTKN